MSLEKIIRHNIRKTTPTFRILNWLRCADMRKDKRLFFLIRRICRKKGVEERFKRALARLKREKRRRQDVI